MKKSIALVLPLLFICFMSVAVADKLHTPTDINYYTSYENRKMIEDTCRAMIASYKTDVDIYNMYKDSDDEEKLSWAEQARMRANKTANSYNEYVLKNSYVWNGNAPIDITNYLPPI